MLLVIFGAGASYDSSPDFRPRPPQAAQQNFGQSPSSPDAGEFWRPPLANQLFLDPHGAFGDIVRRYDRLHPILSRLRQPPTGRSVEEQLELFQNEAGSQTNPDRERKRQLFAIRYYLYELFREVSREWLNRTNRVTNYVSLVDQIRQYTLGDGRVAIVTFNYDSLLDSALLSFSYNPQNDLDRHFDAHPTLKLFRPHGSVNWSRFADLPSGTRRQPMQLIEQADNFDLTNDYVVAVATDPHQFFSHERPIVPAIAIPFQTKTEDTFEWPRSHRVYLEQLLPHVRKILIIGWRAKEAHFLEMLRDKLPRAGREVERILVVGKDADDGKEILHRFAAELGQSGYNTRHLYTDGGFGQFVADNEVENFLKR